LPCLQQKPWLGIAAAAMGIAAVMGIAVATRIAAVTGIAAGIIDPATVSARQRRAQHWD
jgi:hypothetical protein